MNKSINKVVLAYSGGLDTSAMLLWLKETYGCEVVCYCADVGQGDELSGLEEKAKATGASKLYVEDLREEFVRDFVWTAVKANALYEGVYLLGTSLARPDVYRAYREMTIPAGPEWVEEHIRRLTINGIQTHFQLATTAQLETVERMMRNGTCNVPLILTWVAIGGGFDQPNIYNLANFVRAVPDGAVLTLETSMLNVLPLNMMAIAMGLHVRCGIEDNLWTQDRKAKMSSVRQVEQLVRISREFGRDIASAKEAREIYRIGEFYADADETLARNGFAPNRNPSQRRPLRRIA